MTITPYLNFNGNCKEAFELYEKALGGKIAFVMTNGESPMAGQIPADRQNQIMHITLVVGDMRLQGSDAPPDRYQKPQGLYVALATKSVEEAENWFKALSAGGQVGMELQKTFWAERFGMFTDRFGIPWMINCGDT